MTLKKFMKFPKDDPQIKEIRKAKEEEKLKKWKKKMVTF